MTNFMVPRKQTGSTALLLEAPLDKAQPLQRQVHARLKQAILNGRMPAGTRLPGSRALAQTLGVSRNTVSLAYEHLLVEGYVTAGRQGTVVAAMAQAPAAQALQHSSGKPKAATRVSRISLTKTSRASATTLLPGVPALSHFPLAAWRKAMDRSLQKAGTAALHYGDPLGQMALRSAIARHLALTRGVRCEPHHILITEGSQEALMLCVRLLTNPGDVAWVEDPGYRGAKAAMRAGDLRVVPHKVDGDGLHIAAKCWRNAPPKLIYTTPSHQYPTGVVMSVARRLSLIAAAREHGAWIIEDDYDSEFQHSGEPIAAMQGLVPHAPVLYVGTFSKTLFPSLRLGFLVLPESLLTVTTSALREMQRGGPAHTQLALADFMESGHFVRHLGRMRRLYRERQQVLRDMLQRHLHVPHSVQGGRCGLHLSIKLPAGYSDVQAAEAARRYQMQPLALSTFSMEPTAQDVGLVLGYGNTAADLLEPLIKRLNQLIMANVQ